MRRAIVNVATGGYIRSQARFLRQITKIDPEAKLHLWTEEPPGCPPHDQRPYAFKAYALQRAAEYTDLILWVDAVVFPVRSLEPLWRKIEREGYWIALNGWTNYEWTADSAYGDLFPGVPIEEARITNKSFPQVVATAFGLNLRSEIGAEFLKQYYRLAHETRCFCGPWSNTANPRANPMPPDRQGICGPPDVLGHRHDQTAASVIAWRLGMELTECPEIFSYYPPADSTILCTDGGGIYE